LAHFPFKRKKETPKKENNKKHETRKKETAKKENNKKHETAINSQFMPQNIIESKTDVAHTVYTCQTKIIVHYK